MARSMCGPKAAALEGLCPTCLMASLWLHRPNTLLRSQYMLASWRPRGHNQLGQKISNGWEELLLESQVKIWWSFPTFPSLIYYPQSASPDVRTFWQAPLVQWGWWLLFWMSSAIQQHYFQDTIPQNMCPISNRKLRSKWVLKASKPRECLADWF